MDSFVMPNDIAQNGNLKRTFLYVIQNDWSVTKISDHCQLWFIRLVVSSCFQVHLQWWTFTSELEAPDRQSCWWIKAIHISGTKRTIPGNASIKKSIYRFSQNRWKNTFTMYAFTIHVYICSFTFYLEFLKTVYKATNYTLVTLNVVNAFILKKNLKV